MRGWVLESARFLVRQRCHGDEGALAKREQAQLLNQIAYLLEDLGNPDEASLLYERALALMVDIHGEESMEVAKVCLRWLRMCACCRCCRHRRRRHRRHPPPPPPAAHCC